MPRIYEGTLDARGKKFGIVIGRRNELLSHRLLEGALDCLRRHGADDESIAVVWVPGSFEVPQLARRVAASGHVDAVICLGALLRGDTPHFEHVAAEATRGLARIAAETGVPVAHGVLAADTLEQGLERAGTKGGNRGWEAALTAIEMARLVEEVAKPAPAGRPSGKPAGRGPGRGRGGKG